MFFLISTDPTAEGICSRELQCSSETHQQEGKVPGALHHDDFKVAHHNLAACVLLYQFVLVLGSSCHAQTVLGSGTNDHCKEIRHVSLYHGKMC